MTLFPSTLASATEGAKRKAFEQADSDGLTRIFTGAAYVLYGLALGPHWTVHPPLSTIWGVFIVLLTVAAIPYTVEKFLVWLKVKVVYPRTGYVSVDGPMEFPAEPSFFHTLVFALVFLSIAAGLFLFLFESTKWIFLFAGGGAVANSYKSAPGNWIRLLAILSLTVIVVLLNVSFAARFGVFLDGLGAVKIVDGAVALVLYLRRNPLARMPQE
jgi:hypothetical protein